MLTQAVADRRGLTEAQLKEVLAAACADARFAAKRILFVVPDATRSCPLPFLFRSIVAELAPRGAKLAFLAALGTHPVPPDEELWRWFGLSPAERAGPYRDIALHAHDWRAPAPFTPVGPPPARRTPAEVLSPWKKWLAWIRWPVPFITAKWAKRTTRLLRILVSFACTFIAIVVRSTAGTDCSFDRNWHMSTNMP